MNKSNHSAKNDAPRTLQDQLAAKLPQQVTNRRRSDQPVKVERRAMIRRGFDRFMNMKGS